MSRLINNQIWNARSFASLSVEDKLMFLYLETSPETNYYGVFLLPPDEIISTRTGLSISSVQSCIQNLVINKKIALVDDYIIIYNYFDKQKGEKSEKTIAGYEKFKNALPKPVLDTWLEGVSYPHQGGIVGASYPHEESKVKESKLNQIKNKVEEIKNNPTFEMQKHLLFPLLTENLIDSCLLKAIDSDPDIQFKSVLNWLKNENETAKKAGAKQDLTETITETTTTNTIQDLINS